MDLTITVSAIVAILGFGLALYNQWRALETSRQILSLAYAQKKQDLLALIISGEAAHLTAKVQAQDLRDEALDTEVPEAKLAIDQATVLMEECDKARELLQTSRLALQSASAMTKSHNDLVYLIEEHTDAVRGYTDKSKIDAEAAALLQPARRLLRLIHAATKPREA